MKLSLKKPQKLRKWHIATLGMVAIGVVLMGLFVNNRAFALTQQVINGLNNSYAPKPSQFTQKEEVYLEISQPGTVSTLDAGESWTKVYFDKDKATNGIVGVLDGAFRACGADFTPSGTCISNSDAVDFRFYAARETVPDPVEAPNFIDDQRCGAPFTVRNSSSMPDSGDWYGVALRDYMATGCNGKPIEATVKTGKVVIFVQAVWRQAGSDRTNAFKVGGAYTDGAPALAGYWSNYEQSITQSPANIATTKGPRFYNGQYAVQDRVGSNTSEQGNYSFAFGPDCYLAKDQNDPRPRYLKWYDVDLNFYSGLPSQPSFELRDISTGDLVELTDVSNGQKYTTVQGAALGGKNIFKQMRFQGKGGHIYAWRWRNIVQRDGIVFWMPYDDFPYLNNGCGSYKQNIGLQGTRGAGWSSNDFSVAGGDTVTFSLDERYDSGTSAAPETTSNATLTSQGGALFANTFEGDGAINISDGGYRNGSRVKVQWKLPGMGPGDPYISSRRLYFSYKVKDDAQNGARHCFNADLTPVSNTNPTGTATSNTICVTIDNSLRPFVGTSGADVHAGSCNLETGSTKSITGQISPSGARGSSGSYVVSAGGSINGFGSGGSPVGTGLTLGKNGRYGPMCRPTDQAMKTELDKDKAIEVVWTNSTTLDLGRDIPAGRVKVTMPGGGSITGTARGPVTIYSPGTVTITGATVGAGSGAASRTNLPVVGVIARDIAIQNNVTTLNAILYATGNIDTCSNVANWSASGFAGCRSTLTLNGFAMAGNFSFKRISAATSGVQAGEQLNFNAAFYLNPPPGFGSAAGAVRYLGERTPLY